MLDPNRIRNEADEVKIGIKNRGLSPDIVENFILVDANWREVTVVVDSLRAKQKELSKEKNIEDAKKNKEELKTKEVELSALKQKRDELLDLFPNITSADVPVGKSEAENKILREEGERPKFDFNVKNHGGQEVDHIHLHLMGGRSLAWPPG